MTALVEETSLVAHATAPPADTFAEQPVGWHVLTRSRDIGARPLGFDLFGRRLVAYRTRAGDVVALGGRCWHMGADLAGGCVVDDHVQCPFHGWRFAPDGSCANAADARQPVYATAERAGIVFVFPAPTPAYPLPFFGGVADHELLMAPPFGFVLNCPWWLVGTNGFDVQHFLGAHDRRLASPPRVETPHPAARRVVAEFDVTGTSWRDRLTRRFSGPRVMMDVTVWSGTLIFVAARFRRTTTYGMVEIRPLDPDARGHPRTRVTVRIFVRRRRGIRAILDPVDVRIRARFIRAFLEPDSRLLDGARYHPDRLVEADRVMIDYLRWLAPVSHGPTGEPT